jgi:hypothetical protein
MLEMVIAVIGALTGLGSLWFTERQWQKINKKIAMITDVNAAIEVLPAWYVKRMLEDHWYFGLQTSDGHVIAISRITSISDDGKWMDVELLTKDEVPQIKGRNLIAAVADDRRKASIQINNIVAAYDIVNS